MKERANELVWMFWRCYRGGGVAVSQIMDLMAKSKI